ncbi:hypothetical protein [Marinobacter apostichopi]|uniref:hypothetical protein n=1 Tax=Marinobacter apostichopi TaxID=3035454 RepID=UPI0025739478|nr:hypothetical protein [Marinobacter sp. LA51]
MEDFMGRLQKNKFALMSNNELLAYLWERYCSEGIASLSYPELKKEKGLYFQMYGKGLKINDVISKLGLEEEYQEYKNNNFTKRVDGVTQRRWTWARVLEEAAEVANQMGFLPPAQWFQQNGKGSLVFAVYKFNKTWTDLREEFDCFKTSDFVQSRNGMRWRSHPEASLSNFLYSRGIEHKKGEKYPEQYSEYGDSSYGYYDLHFKSSLGSWVDVEIWGDKPNGHAEDRYEKVRLAKERFNKVNPNFLGIEHKDCFNDDLLAEILDFHIGQIEPFVFDRPTDKVLQPTHWSNADELIEYCKEIAACQPDGLFPTEEWLRKRGKWRSRPGPTYNTVSIYIKTWIGGIRKLRRILGQEEGSTIEWTRESALKEYKAFYQEHGILPGQARRAGVGIAEEVKKKAVRVLAAVNKHFGTATEANQELGLVVDRKTKWSTEELIAQAQKLYKAYGLTPGQIKNLNSDDKLLFGVLDCDKVDAGKIADRASAYFDSAKSFYDACGIEATDMRLLRRQAELS